MTNGISGRRRRTAVSASLPVTSSDPVDQLDQIVEIFHQVNWTLPKTVLGREELIALGGLLTQVNGALVTLTDLLSTPTHHYDRTRPLRADTDTTPAQRPPSATSLLQDCRDGYLAAHKSARALHADLRLAIFLFAIGVLLNRSADNLDDCLQNVKKIAEQARVIVPAVEHINRTGGELVGTLPLLYESAERIGAKSAPALLLPLLRRV